MKTLSETIHEVLGIKPKTADYTKDDKKNTTRLTRIQETARRHKQVMSRRG